MRLSKPLPITGVVAILLLTGFLIFRGLQGGYSPEAPKQPDFNFAVRPILSDNCFLCHGPDSSSRKANLRLDTYEGITGRTQHGARPVVPGNWSKSEIIRRVTSSDPAIMMPPPEMNKSLSETEVATLKNWIQSGAEWKDYWAFIPPVKPVVPAGESTTTTIDFLLDQQLAGKGLEPVAPADRSTLIRRLYFLLTGLPPAPEAVASFEKDQDPQAYERLVDELLASPHFGERWARHWMDLVRYADTRGHEFDYPVNGSWYYRDYLIRAFNADLPYDQFLLEQLAGDQLKAPRVHPEEGFNESILGTAFHSLSEGKHSPVDIKEEEMDRIDNMIDVTTKTFLALTVGCAKCHDHKFDPITAEDYYALYGMLESTRITMVPTKLDLAKIKKIDQLEDELAGIRQYIHSELADNMSATPAGKVIAQTRETTSKAELQQIGDFRDGSLAGWFAYGNGLGNALGQVELDPATQTLTGFHTGKFSSKLIGKGLQGALRSPTFTLQHDSILIRAAGEGATLRIIIDNFQLIQNPIYGGLEIRLNDSNLKDYFFDVSMWKGHKAYVELLVGQYGVKRSHLYHIERDDWLEAEYAYAFDSLQGPIPPLASPTPPASPQTALGNWSKGEASAADIQVLNRAIQNQMPELNVQALMDYEQHKRQLAEALFDSTFLTGVTEGDAVYSPVFLRGNHQQLSAHTIPHRNFSALAKDSEELFNQTPSGRLEWAQSLVRPDHPLTSRVMVNRIWHHLFGRGIVETVDNFGLQGKPPSHPELLDYLAVRFVEEGWSIKTLIRNIVLTEAFQRSTTPGPEAARKDPNNTYLSHYPVRRLEAEAIRDAVLAVSGRLDSTQFGPGIPIYLTEFLRGRGRPPKSGPLDGEGRRSIYQQINRNFLPPTMLAFDMPVPFSTFGKRNVSNVPAQSLTLMNDPFVVEMADYWAGRLLEQTGSLEERLQLIYLAAFSRKATSEELEQARTFFAQQARLYAVDPAAAREDRRIWKDFCHSVFNMKAFIFLI